MKTKNIENKILNKLFIVSAIIVILVIMASVAFIYMPFANKNKFLRADILKERNKNIIIGNIKALSKYIKIYNKRIPDSIGVSWLLNEVSERASKESIEIVSIKPGNPEDYGLYTKLFVIIDITSTYDQLGKFVASIESSEKFLKIEKANIKRIDFDGKFEKGSGKYKAFDIKGDIVISTIMPKE